MISYVEIEYYDDGSEVEISSPSVESFNELNWALSIEDSSSGRCFSIMPSVQVIRKGISEVKIGMPSLCKVYIHTPGVGVKHAGRFSTYFGSVLNQETSAAGRSRDIQNSKYWEVGPGSKRHLEVLKFGRISKSLRIAGFGKYNR